MQNPPLLSSSMVWIAWIGVAGLAFTLGWWRALALLRRGGATLHSLPVHYGIYATLLCVLPAAVLQLVAAAGTPPGLELWLRFELHAAPVDLPAGGAEQLAEDARALAEGRGIGLEITPELRAATRRYDALRAGSTAVGRALAVVVSLSGLVYALRRIGPALRARNTVERATRSALALCSGVAILATLGIVLSLIFEALRFFAAVSPTEFLFGTHWSPQTALRPGQVGSSGAFGAIPLLAGTALITLIAMAIAVPVGLFSAIYLSHYAPRRARLLLKPALEILAGVPTVVYGFFAAIAVGPLLRRAGTGLGLEVASDSALAAGLVMGVMIIPFVSSLSEDVLSAVPQSLREGALGLGSTHSETIRRVVLPAALPGIAGAVLLAISRAVGETMIVVMAAGLAANLTWKPWQAVTTVTVQIQALLVGDQEFDSPKTLAAFALGLLLFFVTLALNLVALRVVKRYREQIE